MTGLTPRELVRTAVGRRLVRGWRGFGRIAPVATAAVLVATTLLPQERMVVGDARHAEIAAVLEAAPHRLGRWFGVDVPVPTEAKEILRANAILSRQYRSLGGDGTVTLAVIHCVDVRDMTGHHPPDCYPAAGWSLAKNEPEGAIADAAFTLPSGVRMPVRLYRFERADRTGGLMAQTVLSAFILPDGSLVTDMALLLQRAGRRARSAEGVAQLQFVFPGRVAQEAALAIAEEIVSELPPEILGRLGVGRADAPAE